MKRCAERGVAAVVCLALAACAAGGSHAPPSKPRAAPAAGIAAAEGPAEADRRFQAALQLMKQQKRAEAQAAFAALARDFPQYSGPLANLGILYARERQNAQALASFAAAVERNPDNAVALNWLGVLYRESGDYARAEQAYLKAIAVHADDAVAHFNLGLLYDQYLHRPAEAIAQYREYQRCAGGEQLIVWAWIRELEAAAAARTASAGAP